MPFQPDDPFPKQRGYSVRSKDWNDLVLEVQRLDRDKLNNAGDTMTGPLTIASGPRTVHPVDKIHLEGQLGIYAPETEHSQNALNFASTDRSQEFFLHRYTDGYQYADLASDHNIFPRVAIGAANDHLFIGTRTGHQVVLSTNDHPRLVVGAEGNIGIGTATPNDKLEVSSGDNAIVRITMTDDTKYSAIAFYENNRNIAGIQYMGTHYPRESRRNNLELGSLGDVTFWPSGGVETVRFKNSGDVGIGTAAPAARLHIVYAGDDRVGLRVQGDPNDTGLDVRTGNNYAAIQAKSADFSNASTLAINPDGGAVVIPNANLGIRTTAPAEALHIQQPWAGHGIRLDEANAAGNPTGRFLRIYYEGQGTVVFYHQNSNGQFMTQDGVMHLNSDRSLKDDIAPLGDVLHKIRQLRPVSFTWRNSEMPGIGFIAQEVEEVFPDLVSSIMLKDGPVKGLSYSSFGVLAIAALQELAWAYEQRLIALEAQVAALSNSH